jgi:hypothetical protein
MIRQASDRGHPTPKFFVRIFNPDGTFVDQPWEEFHPPKPQELPKPRKKRNAVPQPLPMASSSPVNAPPVRGTDEEAAE